MKNCKIISITGPSGTGKTTISNIISCIFNDSIIISGDDSHRWEREAEQWKVFTHLNPKANDLDKEEDQINSLKRGESIMRRVYNHDTGKFNKVLQINPAQTIIYEGLHTLFTPNLRNTADVKIFIDTSDSLKKDWKIDRDTKSRGYSRKQVTKTIEKRKPDEQKFILPQREFADFIIHLGKSEESSVEISFTNQTQQNLDLIKRIEKIYNSVSDFVKVCNKVGNKKRLIEKTGGNISVKIGDKIIISSSGISLKDVAFFKNFCICDSENISKQVFTHGRPSMELGAHLYLGKCVIHTHPIDLLAILCAEKSRELVKLLFSDYNYRFFEYTPPGAATARKLSNVFKEEILFFENHGVFVSSDSFEKSYKLSEEINELARLFLNSTKTRTTTLNTERPLFPDAAVMLEANKKLNNDIFKKILDSNLQPKFLTDLESEDLLNLEGEKYRIKMEKK
jgi:uridine kinase/ribulose-5-phosphate 4-epimerase/fuculose-1-phosphate aldolase